MLVVRCCARYLVVARTGVWYLVDRAIGFIRTRLAIAPQIYQMNWPRTNILRLNSIHTIILRITVDEVFFVKTL